LKIKIELLHTSSITSKVSLYAILNSLNKIDEDILAWKNKKGLKESHHYYGYNIIINNYTTLSDVLNILSY
jgi:hypothetical protein